MKTVIINVDVVYCRIHVILFTLYTLIKFRLKILNHLLRNGFSFKYGFLFNANFTQKGNNFYLHLLHHWTCVMGWMNKLNEWVMHEKGVWQFLFDRSKVQITTFLLLFIHLQQEAAAAAQTSSVENTSNLTANNQQPLQQPPNNVSAQSGPGSQSLPQNNQQSMRPISSPNSSSSGSRSMSPAVGKFTINSLHIHVYELFTP